jgi:hypothetical protein
MMGRNDVSLVPMPDGSCPEPLSPEDKKFVCQVIAAGCRYQTASKYVGKSVAEIRRAAQHDEAFKKELEKAEAEWELVQMQRVLEATKDSKHWRASTWALERRYPDRYAKRLASVVTREELSLVLEQMADIVAEEVPQRETRQRIMNRVTSLLGEFTEKKKPAKRSKGRRKESNDG